MNNRRLKKALVRLSGLPLNHYLLIYLYNKAKHLYYKTTRSLKVACPSTIMLELTNHCNLACTTCPREYAYGKNMDKGSMDLHKAKNIIDEVWPYLDSIGLTGMGETLLFKEITEIATYIRTKSKGIVISVSTNAQVNDFADKVKTLVDLIDTIQVSVDGLDEVYNEIRRKADFRILDKNLRTAAELCHGTRTDLMLNMVVTRENHKQMASMVSYAAQTGIKFLDFTLINLAAITELDATYYDVYKSTEFSESLKELEIAIHKTPQVLVTGKNFKTSNGFRKCPFPWTHFYICWNGYVAPCCAKPFPKELNFGNVFEKGIMPVLNSRDFRKFRKLWFENKTPDFCYNCHFIEIAPIA